MKETEIEIVSFVHKLPNEDRLRLTAELINNSSADILLFSGHTIGFVNDIEILKDLIHNKNIEAFLELENINSDKIGNCLYRVTNGKLKNLYTNQLFSASGQIENNYELADRFLHELETKRNFSIKGFNTLVLQCGELNILKNYQSEENRVEFRFNDDKDLKKRFDKLLKTSNLILNPIHTPMGNQGKMNKRRIYLSSQKRLYFSTSNTKEESKNLKLESLQYAYFDGKPLKGTSKIKIDNSISRTYKV
ncbi:hypothetical protein H7F15_19070 [Pontibacter sp. Tf4]|uniref:hypothetical protein n=1 Tax=Pontibacter sp. Tf4 TaxID=2761620 RepID=UPI001626CB93|nr:hypothetical protein [Pontibacter sp. Tf4]MBB6613149.1 hypothetical protein [Pontibacter sp. Tf4]